MRMEAEPEPESVYYEEPPAAAAAAANGNTPHDQLFDDLDVPAILRRRMVQ
jgi:hypothetical protein